VEVAALDVAVATAVDAHGTEAPWQPPDRNSESLRIMLDPAIHPRCLFLRGKQAAAFQIKEQPGSRSSVVMTVECEASSIHCK
jgi:hypothetical protein